jgi:selenide,water dikinase
VKSMSTLNRHASHLAQRFAAHACTDITGFGILGHGLEMTSASHVMFQLRFDDIPLLPGARLYSEREMYPGGLNRNRDFVLPHVRFADSIDPASRGILFEPETSGGLLIALDPAQARSYVAQAEVDGIDARLIGAVADGSGIVVE